VTKPTERYTVTSDGGGLRSFRTRESAEEWVRTLDDQGVGHTDIEKIDLGYDPDEVRGIGGN
jgi:hypothetical protein